MSSAPFLTRRDLLKTAALGAVALPALGSLALAADAKKKAAATPPAPQAEPLFKPSADGREHGLRLGITSYSTRTPSMVETFAPWACAAKAGCETACTS